MRVELRATVNTNTSSSLTREANAYVADIGPVAGVGAEHVVQWLVHRAALRTERRRQRAALSGATRATTMTRIRMPTRPLIVSAITYG